MVLLALATQASAQSLEPRAYANAPLGTNFLLAGATWSEGDVAFDPSVHVGPAALGAFTLILPFTLPQITDPLVGRAVEALSGAAAVPVSPPAHRSIGSSKPGSGSARAS